MNAIPSRWGRSLLTIASIIIPLVVTFTLTTALCGLVHHEHKMDEQANISAQAR